MCNRDFRATKGVSDLNSELAFLRHSTSTDPEAARKAEPPLPVISAVARTGRLDSAVGGECVAQANQTGTLNSELPYRVLDVMVDVGDPVKQGQLLMTFDPAYLNEDLAHADRVVTQTKKLMEDIEPFFADLRKFRLESVGQPISTQDLLRIFESIETRELELGQALHDRTTLERDLARLNLLAPFDGVVTDRTVYAGQVPQVGEELLVIGSFDRILPQAESETRSLMIRIEVENPELRVCPGMRALACLSSTQTALRIPAIALINPDGVDATIFALGDEDRVSLIEIETGNLAEGYIEVISG
jgi:multidrug efflux pump subunit AcrA (membrane-fusion protein)